MPHHWILALAIPLFLFFIALEMLISAKKGKTYFKLPETIANLSVGVAERACDLLITGLFFSWFHYLQTNYGIFAIKPGILHWFALLLLTDLVWYWYHRFAHEINLFWAVHIVHHQSEDFNYTVSARITVFQALVRGGFWSILPILGYPAEMITSLLLLHGLYPFFVHTRLIGKLGLLEYIMVTPSHHRVHHASNEKYLDKNYGDMFIIWDKVFGTFQKEEEEPAYGLTHPLKSHSFLWQHFHYFFELALALKKEKNYWKKCRILFGRPDSLDPGLRATVEAWVGIDQRVHPASAALNRYVVWQMGICLLLLFGMSAAEPWLDWPDKVSLLLILLVSLINCGAILEKKTWIFYLEASRLAILLLIFIHHYPNSYAIGLAMGIGFLLYRFRRPVQYYYLRLVYLKLRPFSF